MRQFCTGLEFDYSLRWPSGSQPPVPRFVQLAADEVTDDFARDAATSHRLGWIGTRLHRLLRNWKSDFDINGMLNSYPLHLLSTEQLRQLLAAADAPQHFARALDIGAGSGKVTAQIAPLCGTITTTETSAAMARRLRASGYECWERDLSDGPPTATAPNTEGVFDLVCMLNVIDRSQRPAGLLRAARKLLRSDGGSDDGWLLLATPLPYRPFFYQGADVLAPSTADSLGLPPALKWTPSNDDANGDEWGKHAQLLLERIMPTHGFEPIAFSRLPYISAGDADTPLMALEDLIVLARPIPNHSF